MNDHAKSVWPTGQRSPRTQLREAGCAAGTEFDRERIPPAVAAQVIAKYTRVGDLVLDPDCGAGTVLTESLRAGRHALGLTTDKHWWTLARSNVTAAKTAGAWPDGSVLDARPKVLATSCAAGLIGRVGLVLLALRTGAGRSLVTSAPDELTKTLSCCEPLLRARGHVVVVVRPHRLRDGALADLTTHVTDAGTSAGLTLVDRCIALTAELRGHRLVQQGAFGERRTTSDAHVEVLVFQLAHELLAAKVAAHHRVRREVATLVDEVAA